MLSKLPKHTGDLADLLADIGNPPAARIARALGVSRRTVERWKKNGAPRTALLSLWWLSREGHSLWDCEMAERTRLTLITNESLWRAVKKYRFEDANDPGQPVAIATATNVRPLRTA